MPELTDNQIADMASLKKYCDELGADPVVIGAIAYQFHFPGQVRHTGDVDFAVALDLEDFAKLEQKLFGSGWTRRENMEHRWRSSNGTLLDLIPAGPKLRAEKKITWPESGMTMSLVGFEHVFAESKAAQIAAGLTLKVTPAVILMPLKIVSFMDDPARRAKDLEDIRGLLSNYESGNNERIYSDEVIHANLDFNLVPAFLIGGDLRRLSSQEEIAVVATFFSGHGREAALVDGVCPRPFYRRCSRRGCSRPASGFSSGLRRLVNCPCDNVSACCSSKEHGTVWQLAPSLRRGTRRTNPLGTITHAARR